MDFRLDESQRDLAATIRSFAVKELAGDALSRAHDPNYPWDVARQLGEMGLIGLTIDAEDGGGGGSLMDAVIVIQELAKVCPTSADVFQAGNFGAIRTF